MKILLAHEGVADALEKSHDRGDERPEQQEVDHTETDLAQVELVEPEPAPEEGQEGSHPPILRDSVASRNGACLRHRLGPSIRGALGA